MIDTREIFRLVMSTADRICKVDQVTVDSYIYADCACFATFFSRLFDKKSRERANVPENCTQKILFDRISMKEQPFKCTRVAQLFAQRCCNTVSAHNALHFVHAN